MIIPVLHRILIKQDKLEESNKDYLKMKQMGLVMPDLDDKKRAQASVDTGIVVLVGPTAIRDFGSDSPVNIGDHIAYAKFAGKFIVDPYTHEEYVALNDEDIIAVFKR